MIAKRLLEICSGEGERARLSILIFHRVLPVADPLFPSELDAPRFDALMAHLKRRFNPLPLEDAIALLRQGALPSRAVSITFDDGYADNLTVAAPILHRYVLPATVFIATSYLDGGCMWNDIVIEACRSTRSAELDLGSIGLGKRTIAGLADRRALVDELLGHLKYMDHEERDKAAMTVAQAAGTDVPNGLMLSSAALREFGQYGIGVGAHTRRHPILAKTPDAIAWNEISQGREELHDLLGRPVTLFAYPNGKPGRDYTAEHVRMVREAGFAAAFSTAQGAASSRSDIYQLPRFTPWRDAPFRFDLLMMKNLRHGTESRAS